MKYLPLAIFGGMSAIIAIMIIAIMIIAGRHLRRPGSPKGPTWHHIALGFALFVTAGILSAFPPHSIVAAALVMILGVGFFTLGIATLGGGDFGLFSAAASAMAAIPFLMTPTPVALAQVGQTITCHVRGYRGYEVSNFTADCPDGHSYDFHKHGEREFPGGQVQVIVDPHGVLQSQFVGQENVTGDLVWGILGLLGAAGIVVAAAINNRRHQGEVKHVVNPGFSSGP